MLVGSGLSVLATRCIGKFFDLTFLDDAVESAFMLNDSSTSRNGAAHQAVVYRALYDYDPREASPNIDSEIELTFARGNLINIYGSVDEDGFFRVGNVKYGELKRYAERKKEEQI